MTNKAVGGVVTTWIAFLLAIISGLFLSPMMVRALDTTGYGAWSLVVSLMGLMGILDLGTRSAVTRFVSRSHAKKQHNDSSQTASTALILLLGSAAVVLLAAAVAAASFPSRIELPDNLVGPFRITLVICGAAMSVTIVSAVYGGIALAVQRMDAIGISDLYAELLRLTAISILLATHISLVSLGIVSLSIAVFKLQRLRNVSAIAYPELEFQWRIPSKQQVKPMLDIMIFSTVVYASNSVIANLNPVVVASLLTVSASAYYAIGATLPVYAAAFSRPIAQTVSPRVSRLDALGDSDGIRHVLLNTGRYTGLVLMPIAVTFIARGHTFISIWMGSDIAKQSSDILKVLGCSIAFGLFRHVYQAAFVATGRHRVLAGCHVAEALVFVLFTYYLTARFGIYGAALAVTIPNLAMSVVIIPMLAKRYFGVAVWSTLRECCLRPWLATSMFALLSFWVDRLCQPVGYIDFFLQTGLLLIFALGGAWVIGLDPHERAYVLGEVRLLFRRLWRR